MRVRLARWSYLLDQRNMLALHDLVERRPAALGGKAQMSLQRWAQRIVQRDPLVFAKAGQAMANDRREQARASLVAWAYCCPDHDAVALFELTQQQEANHPETQEPHQYPWAFLARLRDLQVLLDIAERAASSPVDKARAWVTRWVQSLEADDLKTIALAEDRSVQAEDPRVDSFFAFVAARTNASRHARAHLAQRLAVQASDRKYRGATSQLGQELFVLFALGDRAGNGYFVEFGGTDGLELSNTYLLEKEFGWRGIVAEPNPAYQAALRQNRRCNISDYCVWSRSGEKVPFQVVESYPPLSTMAEFENSDPHDRSGAKTIEVATISLNRLLQENHAPRQIDYISIDTEGSELAILEAFDFSAYDVSVFTIEHNFTPAREKIQRLMQCNGFVRVLESFSRWDDWYVREDVAARLGSSSCFKPPLRIAV